MSIIGQINRRTDEELATPGLVERQCDWARANGLDPKEVEACNGDVILTVEEIDGQKMIRYQKFVRNEAGNVEIVFGTVAEGDTLRTVEQLAPLVVPMPDRWDA